MAHAFLSWRPSTAMFVRTRRQNTTTDDRPPPLLRNNAATLGFYYDQYNLEPVELPSSPGTHVGGPVVTYDGPLDVNAPDVSDAAFVPALFSVILGCDVCRVSHIVHGTLLNHDLPSGDSCDIVQGVPVTMGIDSNTWRHGLHKNCKSAPQLRGLGWRESHDATLEVVSMVSMVSGMAI